MAVACASRPGDSAPRPPPADPEASRRAAEALERAETIFRAGEHAEAARLADSLYWSWRTDRSLSAVANRALWLKARALEETGELARASEALEELLARLERGEIRLEAARRLAAIHHATGRETAAIRFLLEEPGAVGEDERALLREAALRLSAADLARIAADHPLRGGPEAVVHAELARSLAIEGSADSARSVARRVVGAAPGTEEAELAEAILGLRGEGRVFRVGAVLPLSGRFGAVGELLIEGIELAVARHRELLGASVPVELDVRDDGSDPERAVELVRRLEEEGALAVIGPVRSESFAAAARARRNPGLLLVSPSAPEATAPAPHAYTLWDRARLEADVAADVGEWVVAELGLRNAAALHPATPAGRRAGLAFGEGVAGRGGRFLGAVPYDPSSTTFEEPIGAVAGLEPDAVFVAAESPRSLLQLAPQLSYYGVDHSVVTGGPTWGEPSVLRRLDPFASDHRVIGTLTDQVSEGRPWDDFRRAYEVRYRKPLRDNVFPALGYDAAGLVLAAAREAGLPLPGAVSRAAAALPEIAGATGVFRPDPGTSTVARRTFVRMVRDGRLMEPDVSGILEWLERARMRADSVARARADSIARARAGRDGPP